MVLGALGQLGIHVTCHVELAVKVALDCAILHLLNMVEIHAPV